MQYFKLLDALKEVRDASGRKETAVAGAKLLGKTIINTGKLVAEGVLRANEQASEKLSKAEGLTPEARQRAEEIHLRTVQQRNRFELSDLSDKIKHVKCSLEDEKLSSNQRSALQSELDSLESDRNRLEGQLAR